MKRLLLATALAALALSAPAFAHHRDHGHDNDQGRGDHHDNGRHEGWKKHHRGDHIEVVYLQPRYTITDYRALHLAPPPPGHRWIRYPDGRYMLVAIATGIIADILLGH